MQPLVPLSPTHLLTDTISLARRLIGTVIVRYFQNERLVGRIVETEAYPPGDAASHAFKGQTIRCGSMFLSPGHAYIYLAYGSSFMLNVSAEAEGIGGAVLVRAVEPMHGLSAMERLRPTAKAHNIATGPGRLAQAFSIDRSLDGIDLTKPGPLWLAAASASTYDVGISTRIGITKNANQPWRFFLRGSPFVSGPRRLNV